jgi:hypothetical protein
MPVVRSSVVVGALTVLGPLSAHASTSPQETRRVFEPRRDFHQALEIQGVVTGEMLPRPFLGLEGAYSIGNEHVQLRVGGSVTGSPQLRLGPNDLNNVMYVGLLDLCMVKSVYVHRIRMCMGGEAGVWQHHWKGPKRRDLQAHSPHVAGALKADYQYSVTPRLGVLFGLGVSIPAVGPAFQMRDQLDRPTQLVLPGPVAGTLRLGVSFRI